MRRPGFKVIRGNKIKTKTNGKNWEYAYLNAYYKIYEKYGFNEFFLALGYKGYVIKKYFSKLKSKSKFHLINTGAKTLTGGRLFKIEKIFQR